MDEADLSLYSSVLGYNTKANNDQNLNGLPYNYYSLTYMIPASWLQLCSMSSLFKDPGYRSSLI